MWDNCTQRDSSHLQSLFNYACRLVLNRPRLSSSSALWNKLGLTSLCTRRKLHLAEIVYKCHHSLAPGYLSSLFCCPNHHHNKRTKNLANLPSARTCYGQRAFAFIGASLWHSFPQSIRDSPKLGDFSRAAFYYLNSPA